MLARYIERLILPSFLTQWDAIYDIYLSLCERNRLEGLIELVADGARGVVEISASQQVLAS